MLITVAGAGDQTHHMKYPLTFSASPLVWEASVWKSRRMPMQPKWKSAKACAKPGPKAAHIINPYVSVFYAH